MLNFEPSDPNYEQRVHASFGLQAVMKTIGAVMTHVAPGEVTIELPFRADLTQQHGYLHAGIVTTIVDSACGYAAYTLMPSDTNVLTVEYKVNFLAPALGTRVIARGHVVKPGRTLTVCEGNVFTVNEGQEKHIVTMLATMMTLRDEMRPR
jgi:uncharacterized protein (TIGR00369 family)